jgi:hypothetical protein
MAETNIEVKNLIDLAKADGHTVYAITISGTKYYYRSINRAEFRDLQEKLTDEAEKARSEADKSKKGLKEDDPQIEVLNNKLEREATAIRDRGEDRLVQKGLIHPPLTINTPAGVIASLADRIMQASGYGSEEEPEIV